MTLYGDITRLETDRGFGFIRDDAGMDWFFVADGVRGGRLASVWVGERVGFVAESAPSGPRATDIHHEQLD